MRTAQIYLYNRSTNVPKHSDESFHYPLTGNCERLDVEAIEYAEFSVLVADCWAPAGDEDIVGIHGMSASTMWSHVLFFSTLHFLVPDVGLE